MTSDERRLLRVRGRARANSEKRPSAKVKAWLAGPPVHPAAEPLTEEADGARQRERRAEVDGELLLRRIGGFPFQVALSDMSPGGCRVRMIEQCEEGESVIARFAQLEPLSARVCWTRDSQAGLQFARALHPAVFDMLLTRLSGGETAQGAAQGAA
jgi:hypothetical protein